MSQQDNLPGPGGSDQQAAGGSSDGANSQNEQSNTSASEKTDDKVAYTTYQKVLDEKKALQARMDEIEREKKERIEAEAKEKNDWQKIAELREQELAEAKAKLTEKDTALSERDKRDQDTLKLHSFIGALTGKVDKKYWDYIPLEQIAVNPETGRPDETSVAKAVESFRANYPELITGVGGPRLPNNAPGDASGKSISYEAWMALPAAEMKKWDRSQIRG